MKEHWAVTNHNDKFSHIVNETQMFQEVSRLRQFRTLTFEPITTTEILNIYDMKGRLVRQYYPLFPVKVTYTDELENR